MFVKQIKKLRRAIMKETLNLEEFNNADMQKKIEIVRSLGIYELRGLARVLGIKSPTTKVREELIENILVTLVKGKPTEPQMSKKGRPYKKLAHLDNIVSMIANQPTTEVNFETVAEFNQELPVFSYKGEELAEVSGVLRYGNISSYFIDLKNGQHVFVSQELVKSKHLETGDYIQGTAFKINDNDQFFVKELTFVNNVAFKDYVAKQYPHADQVLPSEFMHWDRFKILKGGRNIFVSDDPLYIDNSLKTILSFLENENSINIFLGLDLCFEDQMFVSSKNVVQFSSQYLSGSIDGFNRVLDVINMLTRQAIQGKNVILFVYDMGLVLSIIDQKFASEDKSGIQSRILLKKLVSLAEANRDGSSTTLIATIRKDDLDNQILKNDLIRISVKI